MELDMAKEKHSDDKISEGTLHEILLDIKYRLDHLEDIEADNRALIVKLIKQSNSVVKFLASIDMEADEHIMMEDMGKLPSIEKNSSYDFNNSERIKNIKELLDEFMDKRKDLEELEEELKKNREMLTPGQTGEA